MLGICLRLYLLVFWGSSHPYGLLSCYLDMSPLYKSQRDTRQLRHWMSLLSYTRPITL